MGGAKGLLILALAVAAGPALAGPAPSPVTYTVSPRLEQGELTGVVVSLAFQADADGETRLDLPDRSMGRDGAWRHLEGLTIEGATLVTKDGPAVRLVRAPPRRTLTVRYVVTSAIDHEPRQNDGYPAQPWIRPAWFYIDGPSAFATVAGREDAAIRFRWGQWPAGFTLASNLEHPGAAPAERGVLIGGRDVRVVRSGPLRLAVRGTLAPADADLARELETILRAERGFFDDPRAAPYLVTAVSLAVDSGASFTGTGKGDAFAMAATPNMSLDDLRVLLAHEIFHSWNPGRLGQPIGPRGYWLSEGFTDFYARRLLLRERLITPQAFAKVWNEALRTYAVSPARLMPGDAAAKAFWTDHDAERMLYLRGAMLAALWDQRLRRQGSSLDAVLRAQAKAFVARPDAELVDLFVEQAGALGLDVRADIAAYVEQGRPIDLPADLFAPCADLVAVTTPRFDLGFIPQVGADGMMTVTGLRRDSPAYRVGLREGMTVVEKVQGVNGNAAQPYVLRVRAAGGEVQTVTFSPKGDGTVAYQQLAPRPGVAEACGFR